MATYTSKHTGQEIDNILDSVQNKVEIVEGETLTPNKYTTAEKDKLEGIQAGAQVNPSLDGYALKTEIPVKLPNPQKIIFTGAIEGGYDGSTEQTFNVPTGGASVAVVNNLTSTSTTSALAANQGRVLNEEVQAVKASQFSGNYEDLTSKPDLSEFVTETFANQTYQGKLSPEQLSNIADVPNKLNTSDLPTSLPNPTALTFTGAVTGTYNGSEALTVNIPESQAGGIPEAPTDGKTYGRNNATWTEVTSGGEETPIATTTIAGKVMIGDTMSVTETGVLNVADPTVLEGFTILTTDWVESEGRYVYTKEILSIDNLENLTAIVYFDRETVLSSTNRIVPETVGTNLLLWIDSLPTINMVVEQIVFKVGGI